MNTAQPPKPIPVGELLQRLIQRKPGKPPELISTPTSAPAAPRKVFPRVIPEYGAVLAGRLHSHGPGSPPHRLGQYSYFVKILTSDGLKTVWGSDLKRALAESETQPKANVLVGVQTVGYQDLRLPDGRQFRRTRWRIETVEFFGARLRHAHETREEKFRGRNTASPVPAQRPLGALFERAQAFANRSIHNAHDRERFLEQVKDRLRSQSLLTPPAARPSDKDYEPPAR